MNVMDIHARIERLECIDAGESRGAEPYLWTVFFKIDGSTCRVVGGVLNGTATVVATTGGSHGNLSSESVHSGDLVAIPPHLGEFRTRLYPIAFDAPIGSMTEKGGVFGIAAVLMEQDQTSEDDVNAGRRALTAALQKELDAMIPTLTLSHEEPTPAEIDDMKDRVSAAVHDAVSAEVSVVDWIFGGTDMDNEIGTGFFRFSHASMEGSAGTSFPFEQTWNDDGTWRLSGRVIAHDPAAVTIYADRNYGGASQRLSAGRYDVNQLAIGNDRLSSIRIPPGWSVILFAEAGFWGDALVVGRDLAFIGQTLDNRTSSILVEGPFVTIHSDRGFQGSSQLLRAGKYDVNQLAIGNDRLSSIRVPHGWAATIFSEAGFWGDSLTVTANSGYVGSGMDNRTSSIVVARTMVEPPVSEHHPPVFQ
jgi:hypothetical protein